VHYNELQVSFQVSTLIVKTQHCIKWRWTLTGLVPPLPSSDKDFLESFPSPLSVGLVSSVGIGGAGGG